VDQQRTRSVTRPGPDFPTTPAAFVTRRHRRGPRAVPVDDRETEWQSPRPAIFTSTSPGHGGVRSQRVRFEGARLRITAPALHGVQHSGGISCADSNAQ